MKSWKTIAFCAVMALAAAQAPAATVTYQMNAAYAGGTPNGSAPWLTAVFNDHNTTGSVTLTLTASNLVGQEYVSDWMFNVKSPITTAGLTFAKVGGDTATVLKGSNAETASGNAKFDIDFTFASSGPNKFGAGSYAVYTITGTGINALTFDDVSSGSKSLYSAAEINGEAGSYNNWNWYSSSCNTSGWVDPCNGPIVVTSVPVPAAATAGLFTLVGLGLVGLARRRRMA